MLAMVALLIALLAVVLTTGSTMAQGPRTGDNAEEYDDPIPCSEEARPDANTTEEVIESGYYAVFDAFWDYEVGHLSNNFCPPEVTVTTEYDPVKRKNVTVNTRSDANIHISETAFSIDDSYKVTVIDTRPDTVDGTDDEVTGPTIDIADFPFLAKSGAVSAVKPDPASTAENPRPDVFANNSLWWIRLDDPNLEDASEKSDLQVGFSTALLDKADWYGDEDGSPVLFRFDAVHVLKDESEHEAHVVGAHFFAFDPGTSQTEAQWSNVESIEDSEIGMQAGQYRPMQFAFTQPGVYRVQVNVLGHVRTKRDPAPEGADEDWRPISPDWTITSPVQWYTFHVGLEDDVEGNDVSVNIDPVDADGNVISAIGRNSSEVSFKVSASNAGPDAAADALVQVHLPQGLSYSSLPDLGDDVDNPTAGTSVSDDCGGTIVTWYLDSLSAGDQAAMTFTASVDSGAPGRLTATAEIRNLDSGSLDTDSSNNIDRSTLVRDGAPVSAPSFGIWNLSILEHAIPGAHAGDPVRVSNKDGRELSYRLSGSCSDKFTVHSNGQIVLADGADLNYEQQWAFPLILQVSDGVDSLGAPDSTWVADDSAEALIEVTDTDQETGDHPTVTFSLTSDDEAFDPQRVVAGQSVSIHARLENVPDSLKPGGAEWQEEGNYIPNWWDRVHGLIYPAFVSPDEIPESGTKDIEYTVHIKWDGGGITDSYTITWNAPSSQGQDN